MSALVRLSSRPPNFRCKRTRRRRWRKAWAFSSPQCPSQKFRSRGCVWRAACNRYRMRPDKTRPPRRNAKCPSRRWSWRCRWRSCRWCNGIAGWAGRRGSSTSLSTNSCWPSSNRHRFVWRWPVHNARPPPAFVEARMVGRCRRQSTSRFFVAADL